MSRFQPRPLLAFLATLIFSACLHAQIPAGFKQGTTHGFLIVKSADGKVIGTGDQTQVVRGDQIHSRLVFHFRDGSVDDEVTVFRQASTFQLLSDHHVQKGPSFPEPLDVTLDVAGHRVTWVEKKGDKQERKTEEIECPPDLVNGMISLGVENFPADAAQVKFSYLAGSSKPRLIKLVVTPDDFETFELGGAKRRSKRFNLHIEIGGIAGVVAKVANKQPADIKVWMLEGDAPTFLRMRGPFYEGGPIWTAELLAPTWRQDNPSSAKSVSRK